MEDDWKTVEVFLRSISAHEVRDHAYSTIRVIVSEAGEFVDQIRIGAGIRGGRRLGHMECSIPSSTSRSLPQTRGRIDRIGRTNGRHHHPRRFPVCRTGTS